MRPRGQARQSPPPEAGRGRACAPRVGWSCSRALDYSDESMLMVIRSSSLGTLVLVPDRTDYWLHGHSLIELAPAFVAMVLRRALNQRAAIQALED